MVYFNYAINHILGGVRSDPLRFFAQSFPHGKAVAIEANLAVFLSDHLASTLVWTRCRNRTAGRPYLLDKFHLSHISEYLSITLGRVVFLDKSS